MSGIIGHTAYAMLAEKAAAARRLPIAPLVRRNYASYLAGSYLGCDIQTLPAAICLDTQIKVGYGSQVPDKSPITGGAVQPWRLKHEGSEYSPRQIHEMFYGRTHLVFGWSKQERSLTFPWDHLADYLALVVEDAVELFGPGERHLAYIFGWMTHIVGDSLIKSIQPGITLHLLNGKYTPQNRPIQDLYTFHKVVRQQLRLDWRNLLDDLAQTPVEPVQAHYMRVAPPRGKLAKLFSTAWVPERQGLLMQVLAENRSYQRIRNERILALMKLEKTTQGWKCDEQLSRTTGGLTYAQMIEEAEKADFPHALWQIAEAIADLFQQVVERQPLLQELPQDDGPTWRELTQRWRIDKTK